MQGIQIHTNSELFYQRIKHLLEQNPAEYSLMDGVLSAARSGRLKSVPTMIECLSSSGETVAAAMVGGLHLMITSKTFSFSSDLASHLFKNNIQIPGVVGPDPDAIEFANRWCDLKNCPMKLAMNQRIYELRRVIWPHGIPGRFRLVSEEDIPLLADWAEGFYLDAIPWELPSKEKIRAAAEARIPQGMTYFWELDGHPMCMAALSRPSDKSITVNAVYTPPINRRKGYATALVAAVSSEGLNRGKDFCVLYTDLNNPTSNSIYQKIGYRPVGDSKNYIFQE